MHCGRSGTAANANANSDAHRYFASEFEPPNLKQEVANEVLRRNSLANTTCFANDMANILSLLLKYFANGSLRQISLAIPNAMAWRTQKEERSKMRQKCVKIASDMRQKCAEHLGGEHILDDTE